MDLRYTLKRYRLGSDEYEVLGKCLTMDECKAIIRQHGFGALDWYKIQHRDPANTVDVWNLGSLPR